MGAGGGEEEPLRQECAWIGRASFSNGGKKKKKHPPNVQLELHFTGCQTGTFLLRSHREGEGVG